MNCKHYHREESDGKLYCFTCRDYIADLPSKDIDYSGFTKSSSTTSKPVEELKVIEYPKGFRFGNGDDIIVSSEILHKFISQEVLKGQIQEVKDMYTFCGDNFVPRSRLRLRLSELKDLLKKEEL